MAQRLTPVDVVTIGVGLTGSLAGLELAKEGLKVVGLERGPSRDTVPDFQSPWIHDELALFDPQGDDAGQYKGGSDFSQQFRSNGAADPTVGELFARDWPRGLVRALEWPKLPRTDRRLHLQDAYPGALPYFGALFRKGAESLGHHPYPQPSSNLSECYTNLEGIKLYQCAFCGFCERYACEHFAKASPQTCILPALLNRSNYELRTNCQVLRINLDSTRKTATGVTYVTQGGVEYEQPADLVLITAFPLNNVRMLLLSGIGKPYDPKTGEGVVGRNYTYQTTGGPTAFMDESININPFMASGANGTMIDDFGGDNFDHSNLGFIGGQYIGAIMTDAGPSNFIRCRRALQDLVWNGSERSLGIITTR
jgi:choline dehydrogenase-like flavoprotein